jgi:TetR/AcrR family transcriptional repressor of mexJK operon
LLVVIRIRGPAKPRIKRGGQRYGPGRPTLEDLEQRKKRILDVAVSLFVERGYAETSLVDIAKHAGVATRTIYQHYGDKAAIFRTVIDGRVIATEHELPGVDADHSLFDVLVTTAHYICSVAFSGSAIPFQRLMIAESHRFPALMRQIFESTFHRLHFNVVSTFERLAQVGKIPAGNHAETTKFFIDLLLGAAPLQLTMNWIASGPSEKEIRDKVSLFIAGRFGLRVEAEARKATASRRSGSKKSVS